MTKVIYVPELPVGVLIETDEFLLVGTNQKGDGKNEGLCSQERE
ncbi:hypothetical protein [Heyndrickxia oleronia]|nr:hypothetical protein [Heyndrickxia oleronia]GIN38425.1 hypothetical protein J19TS1_13740 [Heyndrickxia oleronia]